MKRNWRHIFPKLHHEESRARYHKLHPTVILPQIYKQYFKLEPILLNRLSIFWKQKGFHPAISLLGAWSLLLSRYTGQYFLTIDAQYSEGPGSNHQYFSIEMDSEAIEKVWDYLIRLNDRLHFSQTSVEEPEVCFHYIHSNIQDNILLTHKNCLIHLCYYADGTIIFYYSSQHFSPLEVRRIFEHFVLILEELLTTSQGLISHLPVLTLEERVLLKQWNDTNKFYSDYGIAHADFERQASKNPDNVALIFKGECYTYHWLNQRANQLAHYLRECGVKAGSLVPILLERSVEMVVAIYGVLKAGGAYVPLNTAYPALRLGKILESIPPSVILTQSSLSGRLTTFGYHIFCLDYNGFEISQKSTTNLEHINSKEDPAYVIFTSGSTGVPKGVINLHKGLCNRLWWMQDTYQLKSADRVLQKTPYTFDVSVWEFFWPLMVGASLVIAEPEGHTNVAYLIGTIQAYQVTTLHFVPSMLNSFVRAIDKQSCVSIKRVISSGEALWPELCQQFFQQLPHAELYNLYGPTEASIDVTAWQCRADDKWPHVPIGRPISNIQIYILDEKLNLVSIGIIGELCIAGVGVAAGYLGQESLTKFCFIDHPLGRLYRTGDRARWLNDGVIEYLGRKDDQVKIRGCRAELSEINIYLREHDAVMQSVVILEDNGRLIAFITLQEAKTVYHNELYDFLEKRLPSYMIPSAFYCVNHIPLSRHGKIDRSALLSMPAMQIRLSSYAVPRTPIEKDLLNIWAALLEVPASMIGINHDFFRDLGGTSLIVPQLISMVTDYFKLDKHDLNLHRMIETPTIERMAKVIALNQDKATSFTQHSTYNVKFPISILQDKGNRIPLFLLHPIGGTLFCYLPLAKYFVDERPIIGIYDPSIESGYQVFADFDEMVQHYFSAICSIQSKGPYLIAGLSFGANLAVALSRELERKGEVVKFIGLLDGWAQLAEGPVEAKKARKSEENFEILKKRTQFLPKGCDNPEFWLGLIQQRMNFLLNSRLPVIDNTLTLFKAKYLDEEYRLTDHPMNYWDSYTTHSVNVFHIPGEHETILQEPHVKELAAILKRCLEELAV